MSHSAYQQNKSHNNGSSKGSPRNHAVAQSNTPESVNGSWLSKSVLSVFLSGGAILTIALFLSPAFLKPTSADNHASPSGGQTSGCNGGVALAKSDMVKLRAPQKAKRVKNLEGPADSGNEVEQQESQKQHMKQSTSVDGQIPSSQGNTFDGPTDLPQTPPPTTSWAGPVAATGGFPADAQIAVSRTHVVVTINEAFAFYNKAGQLQKNIDPGEFFRPLDLQSKFGINRYFDPRVIFDSYRNRFWVVALGFDSAHEHDANRLTKLAVGVSKTEDPMDGWYLYWWDAVAHDGEHDGVINQAGDSGDYPSLGIDSFGIYQTNAVNNDITNVRRYWHVTFFPANLLASGTPASGWQYWDLTNPDGSIAGDLIQPVIHHSDNSHVYFASSGYAGGDRLIVWALTDPLQPTQHIDRVAVRVSPFIFPSDAPQKGSSKLITTTNLGNFVMKAVYRDNKLYLATMNGKDWFNDGQILTSIRLVRLNVGGFPSLPTTAESGFIDRTFGKNNVYEDLPSDHLYYSWPSVEVNRDGDMALVYARSGNKIYPEVRFSTYFASEPDIRPSRLLKAGEAPYELHYPDFDPPAWRWGDTAGLSVDPYDDTSIWVALQYADTHSVGTVINNYALRVGKVFGSLHSDLLIQSAGLDTDVVHPGDPVNTFVSLHNQGDGPSTPTHVFVYLSSVSGARELDFQILKYELRPLASGEATAFSVKGYVPSDIPPGRYYIQAIVDPLDMVVEYSEANNRRLETTAPIAVVAK